MPRESCEGGLELDSLLRRIATAADGPLESARTMPPDAYTSTDLLALEREQIFVREWICVGRCEELARVGSFFTIEVAGEPLIVVRSQGGVCTYPNVCRHKWGRLVDGCGEVGRFVCPYHAWTYDLEGNLVHTRFMDTSVGFEPADHCLPSIRTEIWRGFIYVNLSGDAPALAAQRAEIDERIGDYHMEDMHLICGADEVWATNWKLLVENFTDSYHVFHVHRETIDQYTPIELFNLEDGGRGYCFGSARLLKDAMPESPFEPHHPQLSERHREEFSMIGMFPTQMLALAPDRVFYMCLEPVDVDHVRTKWGVACYDPAIGAHEKLAIEALYHELNAEDRPRVEGIQKGLRSRFAGQGRLSRYENMNWEFTKYYAARVCAGP